ncbi:MAG: glycine zipper family protein [Sinimarinibacterium flocculans]|uniref:glycine zipper family protein n=1 Tax=Sinimarinibacterium flocculans TaxID=985250 RepID=UPI003C3C95C7
MTRRPVFIAASAVLLLAACASRGPIIDTQGVDMARYNQDLSQCETYATQVNTGAEAGKGAVGGAVLGAAIGAIVGNSTTVARGAGVGGVVGGARGAARGESEKDRVVKNCLRGRGYRVLN